jgi:hypothetical protein
VTLGSRIGATRGRAPSLFGSRPRYAAAAAFLFALEVLIALFVRDGFVRPYLGDALAVAMVYCAVRAISNLRPLTAAAIAFAVAVVIELGQYVGVLRLVGLQDSTVARTVLGHGFDLRDFPAYAAGALAMFAIDRRHARTGL